MKKEKEQSIQSIRSRVAHQIVMNLGYETAGERTLRSCGIDHCDITSILTRASVIPRGTYIPYGTFDLNITINQFLDTVENSYKNEEHE